MTSFRASPASAEARPPKNKRQLAAVFPPVPKARFNFAVAAGRLVPLAAAALLLNRPRRELMALIEEGRLRWAFDLRTAASGRGELRVLGQSLMEFAGLCPAAWVRSANDQAEFQTLVDQILPPGTRLKTAPAMAGLAVPSEMVLRGTEVARCFSCNTSHVRHLILDQSLQAVNVHRESNGTPLVFRSSVVNFLKSRRVV